MTTNKAFIFDLDGVISKTQKLHATAWKNSINEFLISNSLSTIFSDKDYLEKFDGRPRIEAISDFLNIIKYKNNKDHAIKWISKNKNTKFIELLNGINGEELFYEDSKSFIRNIGYKHRLAIASSSKNAIQVVKKLNIYDSFIVIVDGLDIEKLSMKGKPAPDIFNLCVEKLDVCGSNAVIFEDSISGVKAALNSKVSNVVWVQREEFQSQDIIKMAENKCKELQIIKNIDQFNLI